MCISINDEVIHGIPGNRALKDGDLVIDIVSKIRSFKSENKLSLKTENDIINTEEIVYKKIEINKKNC